MRNLWAGWEDPRFVCSLDGLPVDLSLSRAVGFRPGPAELIDRPSHFLHRVHLAGWVDNRSTLDRLGGFFLHQPEK
jgi:hypothetical protein